MDEINLAYWRPGNLKEFQPKVPLIKQNEAHVVLFYKGTGLSSFLLKKKKNLVFLMITIVVMKIMMMIIMMGLS